VAPSIEAGRKLLRLRIGLLSVRASTIYRAQVLMEGIRAEATGRHPRSDSHRERYLLLRELR
jgi:hypothetical protein